MPRSPHAAGAPATPAAGARARRHWRWAVPLAMVAALGVLTAIVNGSDVPSADLRVARWVQDIDVAGWTKVLRLAAYLTDTPTGPLVWAGLIVALWVRGWAVEVMVMAVAPAVHFPRVWLEQLVERRRPTPDLIDVIEIGDGFAFPSGHMTLGVAVYGTFALVAFVKLRPGWVRRAVVAASAAIIVLAAVSRPALGAHWPSDALGGALMGAIWVWGLAWLYLLARRPARLPPPLRGLLALAEAALMTPRATLVRAVRPG